MNNTIWRKKKKHRNENCPFNKFLECYTYIFLFVFFFAPSGLNRVVEARKERLMHIIIARQAEQKCILLSVN